MIDTIKLYLPQSEIEEIDALAEIPVHLKNIRQNETPNGVSVRGNLSNLRVCVKSHGVFIEGSLQKYLSGDNVRTFNYKGILSSFEKLSDELRIRPEALDMAKVQRVDYAATLIVNKPEIDYFTYLGEKPYFNRFINNTSLYYTSRAKDINDQKQKIMFYSKTEEMKKSYNPSPKDYGNERLFRYESSILKPKEYYNGTVNVGRLRDKHFHRQSINRWKKDYNSIKKLDALMKDFSMIGKPSDVFNLYLLADAAERHGVHAIMKLPDEMKRQGVFDHEPKYYSRLRGELAKKLQRLQVSDRHELIKELDSKILEAAAEQIEQLKY